MADKKMKKQIPDNILICTLGGSWMVVPEAFYFVNLSRYDFYEKHPDRDKLSRELENCNIKGASRLWIITSDGFTTGETTKNCLKWWESLMPEGKELRVFRISGTGEVVSAEENLLLGEGILRIALLANNIVEKEGCRLYLCLAGGRKTMSNYMQKAGNLFGADKAIHIVGNPPPSIYENTEQKVCSQCGNRLRAKLTDEEKDKEWQRELEAYKNRFIRTVSPMILSPESDLKELFTACSDCYPLITEKDNQFVERVTTPDRALTEYVDSQIQIFRNISVNYVLDTIRKEKQSKTSGKPFASSAPTG